MKSVLFSLGFMAAADMLYAQGFEVSAIKVIDQKRLDKECQSVQWGRRGGPGTESPSRVVYECQPLQLLVLEAFGFADSESFRMPNLDTKIEWTNFVNVTAIVPPQSTLGEFRIMLQNLLAERYNLKSHEETRAGDVYELSVLPGGHKLRPHLGDSEVLHPSPGTKQNARAGADGLIALAPAAGRVLAAGKRDHWRVMGTPYNRLLKGLRVSFTLR